MVITYSSISSHRSSNDDAHQYLNSSVYNPRKQVFPLAQVSDFLMGVSPH